MSQQIDASDKGKVAKRLVNWIVPFTHYAKKILRSSLLLSISASQPVFADETCRSPCEDGLTCSYCGTREMADGQQRRVYHCIPDHMSCLIDDEKAADIKDQPQAFSSRPTNPDTADKALKVIVDTPEKIREIEKQRQKQKDFEAEVEKKLRK